MPSQMNSGEASECERTYLTYPPPHVIEAFPPTPTFPFRRSTSISILIVALVFFFWSRKPNVTGETPLSSIGLVPDPSGRPLAGTGTRHKKMAGAGRWRVQNSPLEQKGKKKGKKRGGGGGKKKKKERKKKKRKKKEKKKKEKKKKKKKKKKKRKKKEKKGKKRKKKGKKKEKKGKKIEMYGPAKNGLLKNFLKFEISRPGRLRFERTQLSVFYKPISMVQLFFPIENDPLKVRKKAGPKPGLGLQNFFFRLQLSETKVVPKKICDVHFVPLVK